MYIIFDIGGTKTRVAASEDLETYGEPIKFDTPLSYSEGLDALQAAIQKVAGGNAIKAMAGGIRGALNQARSGIISESILTDWVDKDITGDLATAVGAPAYLGNDSAMVGLGEATFGAGASEHIVAYMTVSTGVGGARFVDGVLDETVVNFEPGRHVIDIQNFHNQNNKATLEEFVSGTALAQQAGVKAYEIPQSDPVWDELAKILAVGLRNLIMFWSPSIIVLGGSMIVGDPRILRDDIVRHTTTALNGFVPCPKIADATLADEGGLYGAMAYLRMQHKHL